MLLTNKQGLSDAASTVIASLTALDVNDDGSISHDEFKRGAMREPGIMDAMFKCVANACSLVRAHHWRVGLSCVSSCVPWCAPVVMQALQCLR